MDRTIIKTNWNAWDVYIKRVYSIRFISSLILVSALVCALATGIDRLMIDKHEWITPWMAPHFFNNKYFVTFYGFIVCYMFSDVPFMNRSELYFVLRKGRHIWCREKMAAIIMQAFSLTIFTYIVTIIVFFPRLQLDMDWGKIIHTMTFSNNLWEYNIIGIPSPVIMDKYTPIQAMLTCFLMVWMVSSAIGLLMFGLSLYFNRIVAISTGVILTGLNLSELKFITAAWLPYVTPFNWCRIGLHNEQIWGGAYYPPAQVYWILCSVLIIFAMLGIVLKSRHMEYIWNKEE